MSPEDRFVAETSFYVRYAETDAMGIVHHASYIVYFEEGSDYASFERTGHYLTVTEVHARYLKPARYGQRLTVRCWIEEMKSRALTFAYEIVDADSYDQHVTGFSKHICITHDGQIARLPEAWRAWGV